MSNALRSAWFAAMRPIERRTALESLAASSRLTQLQLSTQGMADIVANITRSTESARAALASLRSADSLSTLGANVSSVRQMADSVSAVVERMNNLRLANPLPSIRSWLPPIAALPSPPRIAWRSIELLGPSALPDSLRSALAASQSMTTSLRALGDAMGSIPKLVEKLNGSSISTPPSPEWRRVPRSSVRAAMPPARRGGGAFPSRAGGVARCRPAPSPASGGAGSSSSSSPPWRSVPLPES